MYVETKVVTVYGSDILSLLKLATDGNKTKQLACRNSSMQLEVQYMRKSQGKKRDCSMHGLSNARVICCASRHQSKHGTVSEEGGAALSVVLLRVGDVEELRLRVRGEATPRSKRAARQAEAEQDIRLVELAVRTFNAGFKLIRS